MRLRDYLRGLVPTVLILWGAFSAFFYLLIWYGTDRETTALDTTYIPFDGAVILMAILCMYVYKFYGYRSFEGKVWLLVAIGAILWMVGELISALYVSSGYLGGQDGPPLFLHENVDYPILAGYFFIIAAFIYKAKYAKFYFSQKKVALVLAVILAFALPSILLVCVPVANSSDLTDWDKFVSVAYVVLDIVLLSLGAFIAAYWGLEISKGWYIIALAIASMTVADSMIAALDWQGIYYDGNFFELFYIASFLLFGLGAHYQKKMHEQFI